MSVISIAHGCAWLMTYAAEAGYRKVEICYAIIDALAYPPKFSLRKSLRSLLGLLSLQRTPTSTSIAHVDVVDPIKARPAHRVRSTAAGPSPTSF